MIFQFQHYIQVDPNVMEEPDVSISRVKVILILKLETADFSEILASTHKLTWHHFPADTNNSYSLTYFNFTYIFCKIAAGLYMKYIRSGFLVCFTGLFYISFYQWRFFFCKNHEWSSVISSIRSSWKWLWGLLDIHKIPITEHMFSHSIIKVGDMFQHTCAIFRPSVI